MLSIASIAAASMVLRRDGEWITCHGHVGGQSMSMRLRDRYEASTIRR